MFLLVPIGHDEIRARVLPAATLALVVVNILVFAFTHGRIQDEQERIERIAEQIEQVKLRAFVEIEGDGSGPFTGMAKIITDINAGNRYELSEALKARMETFWAAFTAGERVPPDHPRFVEWQGLNETYRRAQSESLTGRWGFVPGHVTARGALGCLFLHGGYLHLAGNMLMLVLAGVALEQVLGAPIFLALYLLSGLAGSAGHALSAWGSMEPCIGASGAIAGLMGAFLVRFFRTKIRFFYFLFLIARPFWGTVMLPAFTVLPVWFLWQLAQGMGFGLDPGPVAFMAHVGGFAFGVPAAFGLAALGFKRPSASEQDARELAAIQARATSGSRYMPAHRAFVEGRYQEAVDRLREMFESGDENVGARLTYIRALTGAGEREEAATQAESLSRRLIEAENLPLLLDLTRTIKEAGLTDERAARVQFQTAKTLEDARDPLAALEWYDDLAARFPGSPLAPKALLRAGIITRQNRRDPVEARRRFEDLVARYGDHPLAADARSQLGPPKGDVS